MINAANERDYYILDENGDVQLIHDLHEWGKFMQKPGLRKIAVDIADDGSKVSTYFLGLDHNFGDYGPPILFETMIFDSEHHDSYCERYATREEALVGHAKALALANEKV